MISRDSPVSVLVQFTVFSIFELQFHSLIDVGHLNNQNDSVPYARFNSFHSTPLTWALLEIESKMALPIRVT
jgi:hypothetical protein